MYFINYYLLPLYDYCYCYDLYSVLYVLPRLLMYTLLFIVIYTINGVTLIGEVLAMMIWWWCMICTLSLLILKSQSITQFLLFSSTYYSNAWYWNATTRHLHTFVFHLLCFLHRLTTGKYYRQTTMNAKRSWTDLLQSKWRNNSRLFSLLCCVY